MEEKKVLVRTRKEQFKYLLKTRWTEIVFSSIYLFIFIVPTLLYFLFISSVSFSENNLLNISLIYLISIPLIVIYGLGVGGVLYSFKRICYSEGANIHRDLFYGIKKTYKDFAKIYFFKGLLYALLHISIAIIVNSNISITLISIFEGLLYLSFFFLVMIINFMETQAVFYNSTFNGFLLNSIRFSFGKILTNILINLIYLIPFLLFDLIQLSGNIDLINIIEIIAIAISGLFYFGFNKFLFLEYSISIFDETINKKQYPEIIKKGLHKEEKVEIDISTL